MTSDKNTPGPVADFPKPGWARSGIRLYLAYLLTAVFVVTSILMIVRVAFVVGTLAFNWHMQPIPGMVVDHAVLADGRAQFQLAATAEPCGVFVVKGARARSGEEWVDGKLGKDRLLVDKQTYPIMWEATNWTAFPNRSGAGAMDSCTMSTEHGSCVVRTGDLGPEVVQAIENSEAFIVVAYNPQDIDPRRLEKPLS